MKYQLDQWRSEGDCNKCRRKKYCSKQCKARKLHNNYILQKAITSKPYKTFLDK